MLECARSEVRLKSTVLPRVVAVAVRSPRFCLFTLMPVAFRFTFSAENNGVASLRGARPHRR